MATTIVRDPVCGMLFPAVDATAVLEYEGVEYHFCSDRCRGAFQSDPKRFAHLAPAPGRQSHPAAGSTECHGSERASEDGGMPAAEADHRSTRCPFCGTETGIHRVVEPDLGSLSPAELETLVHNEWRRRLGTSAYARAHPMSLIRALVAFARDPANPGSSATVDDELEREAAALADWGLNPRQIQAELFRLSQAIWDVLSWTNSSFDRSRELMERMDRKLMAALVDERIRAIDRSAG